jgi:hypothetical protein
MAKRSQQRWLQVLDSMVQDGVKLASHWAPRGAAELEKQTRNASKTYQDYRQRKLQTAALKPRKARLLWLLPLPLIPATVIALGSGEFTAFIANAISYCLFVAGSMLARQGFQQEVSQQRQQFQSNGRWPFKTLGGLTVALATALTAWAGAGHNIPIALAFGAGAFTAFVLLYGLDPRQKPTVATSDNGSHQRVAEALRLAEQKIIRIEQASQRIHQTELNQRLGRIIALAREILAQIARDPRDLRRARKFLNTYLDGAQRVVSGYAEIHSNGRVRPLEANFRRVLISIEEVFERQHQRLLENDLLDLDVQIEVLETQLKREGLD